MDSSVMLPEIFSQGSIQSLLHQDAGAGCDASQRPLVGWYKGC
jgi:hypothetical protein